MGGVHNLFASQNNQNMFPPMHRIEGVGRPGSMMEVDAEARQDAVSSENKIAVEIKPLASESKIEVDGGRQLEAHLVVVPAADSQSESESEGGFFSALGNAATAFAEALR